MKYCGSSGKMELYDSRGDDIDKTLTESYLSITPSHFSHHRGECIPAQGSLCSPLLGIGYRLYEKPHLSSPYRFF